MYIWVKNYGMRAVVSYHRAMNNKKQQYCKAKAMLQQYTGTGAMLQQYTRTGIHFNYK